MSIETAPNFKSAYRGQVRHKYLTDILVYLWFTYIINWVLVS